MTNLINLLMHFANLEVINTAAAITSYYPRGPARRGMVSRSVLVFCVIN